jgi:hypothetical protein
MKIKVIPILIKTEIFPSVQETWYLKTCFWLFSCEYVVALSVKKNHIKSKKLKGSLLIKKWLCRILYNLAYIV